jgi:uncharacterized protein YkwD
VTRAWLTAVVLASFVSTAVANSADALAVVNGIRLKGCPGRQAAGMPLRPDTMLDQVATRLARGGSLADAVRAEKYPAQRSASITVQATPSAAAFATALESGRYCGLLTDPMLTRAGVAVSRRQTTLVLAVPFEAPVLGGPQDIAIKALSLVNAARARSRRCGAQSFGAAPALQLDAILTTVAAAHARDMAARGRMSHLGSDGSEPAERMTRAGYPWALVAENVAAGQRSVDEVIATWLASPGHCSNIMNPLFREFGLGYVFDAGAPDGTYWVQTFGTRR